jgi:hypothetical protein
MVHPESSFYSPDYSAHRPPNHSPNGACTSVTFVDAMSDTAGYSLSARDERNRKYSNKSACKQSLSLH